MARQNAVAWRKATLSLASKVRRYSIHDLHRALVGAEFGVESNLAVIRGAELVELLVVPQEVPQ